MIALPTNKDENWRYANLQPLAKARVDAVAPSADETEIALPPPLEGFARWVYVDGHHAPWLSNSRGRGALPSDMRSAGKEFTTLLDDEIANAGVDFSLSRVNAVHGEEVLWIGHQPFYFANVEVLFVASAGAQSGTSYPRLQVQVPRDAKLNLVERHISVGAENSAVNGAVDIALAPGSEVNHSRVQELVPDATAFDTLTAHVGERATYRLRTITLGGASTRSTLFIKLAGRGARCDLTAASVANGIQTHDVFAEIEHAAPQTVTRELFRGIATERGKLAFNGKIIVRDNAHESDSEQSLKSLLTGSGAEAATRPQLEIYTDRVRAAHGATTGKLDDQMLFYLLSRGIERATAQALLQWAFIEDAVSRVTPPDLREDIERAVLKRLSAVASLDGLLGKP